MSIVLTVLGISLLIVLHEAGHFVAARACGMRVPRFSLGFGPAVGSFQYGETTFQLALVPLGGYVEIAGMGDAAAEVAVPPAGAGPTAPASGVADDPRAFTARPPWQRAAALVAGPAANWAVALALLVGLAATAGVQVTDAGAILGEIGAGGPAARAGLRAGDQVLAIDGAPIDSWAGLVAAVRTHPAQALAVDLRRDGADVSLTVVPDRQPSGEGAIDVMPAVHRERARTVLAAAGAGARATWRMTHAQAGALWQVVTGGGAGRLAGLPGIVRMVAHEADRSLARLVEALAYLSVGLGLLNLAPLPALDGGRLLFLGIETVRRRPLSARAEGLLHTAGFVALIGLMIFVSLRDVVTWLRAG